MQNEVRNPVVLFERIGGDREETYDPLINTNEVLEVNVLRLSQTILKVPIYEKELEVMMRLN